MGVSPISFHIIEVEFNLTDPARLTSWLSGIARKEQCFLGRLGFHFCSDDYLLAMNQDHLDHDYYTDVITFDESRLPLVNGDVFISLDRVRDNAKSSGEDSVIEVHRVMAHGLLHLLGYSDKTLEERAVMRKKENWALSLLV